MSKFTDNIRKIAHTAEIEAKIKAREEVAARGEWEGGRGTGFAPATTPDTCPLFYTTQLNSFDIAALLAGTAGPTMGDRCSRLDTITGLTDFDTTLAGETVTLIIQTDGIFT